MVEALFGKAKGPSAGEQAMQQDRMNEANKADAEANQKAALATRAASLRKTLAYNDREKRGVTGA